MDPADNSRPMTEEMRLLSRDLSEQMTSQFSELDCALDRHERRVHHMEELLKTEQRQKKYGPSACESYGAHRHTKQRRDFYFEMFMEKLSEMWALQREVPTQNSICEEKNLTGRNKRNDEDIHVLNNDIARLKEAAKSYWMKTKVEEERTNNEYGLYESQAKSQDCSLYRSFWCPEKFPGCEKMDFLQAQVSTGGGLVKTFKEATLDYLTENFTDAGVFRVPPYFLHKDRINSKQKSARKNDLLLYSDEELLALEGDLRRDQIDKLIDGRRADCAVDEVVIMLEKWAKQNHDNMFIFSDYQYSDYLKNVKTVKVSNIKGDHDIMAISERYGVLFFQVKSCRAKDQGTNSNVRSKTHDALEQTLKDRFVFLQSNRDLPFVNLSTPIHGFVALPNVEDGDLLDNGNFCCYHGALVLTSSSLGSVSTFSFWLHNALATSALRSPRPVAFSHDQFREICGRYVGLASSVNVPTLSKGIKASGRKLSLNLLTPRQREVVNSTSRLMIISGDTGTGKSLLLAKKARQIMDNAKAVGQQCRIHIVTCTDINDSLHCALKMSYRSSQQLEKFLTFLKDDINITQFRVLHTDEFGPKVKSFKVTPDLLVETIKKLTRERDGTARHILMDEVPFELLKQAKELLDATVDDIPVDTYVWLTVCTHTYRVDSRLSRDPCWIKEHMPSAFDFRYLELVKRIPRSLFNLVKAIQAYTGDGHSEHSKCGHVIDGLKPMLYRIDKCRCAIDDGEDDSIDYMSCRCVQWRVHETFRRIFQDVLKSELRDDITVTLHNFAIHGSSFTDLKRLLDTTFERLNIPLTWSTVLFKTPIGDEELDEDERERERVARSGVYQEPSDLLGDSISDPEYTSLGPVTGDETVGARPDGQQSPIMVVDTRTFVGCEGKIVISFDQCGMFHYFVGERGVGWFRNTIVRCVAQYIYVTWPEDEAARNWRKYLKEYSEDVFARNNLTQEQLDFRKDQMAQGRAASYKPSCLAKLLEQDLFVVKS